MWEQKKKDQTPSNSPPEAMSDLEKESQALLDIVEQTTQRMPSYYEEMLEEKHSDEEIQQQADSLKRASSNIGKAFSSTYQVSDELNSRWKDMQKQKKRHLFSRAPSNGAIDLREIQRNSFARGLNGYKLLLICFIGSFFGVVVEMLWCLITNGYLESRAGLVYGPFNLLYGIGAVVLTVCLYRFRNRSGWISFAGGMLVGSAVEYVCSWGQEMIFGTRSWDYSQMPFNINGRICLLYSIFWGLLGVFWIKDLYPRMAKLILKLPNLAGKIITWVLVAFFVFNCFMTVTSSYRWSERRNGIPASNSFAQFLDQHFPDARMERIFANAQAVDHAEQDPS